MTMTIHPPTAIRVITPLTAITVTFIVIARALTAVFTEKTIAFAAARACCNALRDAFAEFTAVLTVFFAAREVLMVALAVCWAVLIDLFDVLIVPLAVFFTAFLPVLADCFKACA